MYGLNCRRLRPNLVELARGAPLGMAERQMLAEHLEKCPDCAHDFEAQARLTAAFGEIAEAPKVPELDAVPVRLWAEFDAAKQAGRSRLVYWLPVAAALLAAAVLTGRFLITVPTPAMPRPVGVARQEPPRPSEAHVQTAAEPSLTRPTRARRPVALAAPMVAESQQPFVEIPYTAPIAAYERTEVLRMDLPVSAVIAAGVPVDVADQGARAEADVLVGEDGRAHAIRVISVSTFTQNRQETQ